MNFGKNTAPSLTSDNKLSEIHVVWSFEDEGLVI